MTPTLSDVVMLTGLNISADDRPFDTVTKPTHRLTTKNIGGWKGYITEHTRIGAVSDREHTAFLNMWLEKSVFCGPTCGPTTNMQPMAERLVNGSTIPLGKHLLGAVYQLLHQVLAKLTNNQSTSNIGGPWWFIQLWLNMYTYKAIGKEIISRDFPDNHLEEEENRHRRCMNYVEAVSSMPLERLTLGKMVGWFKSFYNGFKGDAAIWYAYEGHEGCFERPLLFQLEKVCDPNDNSKKTFQVAYNPCFLPTNFSSAKNRPYSYEFYHPSVSACQLGFGQLPIHLLFAYQIKS
jgi:hypothetical protein